MVFKKIGPIRVNFCFQKRPFQPDSKLSCLCLSTYNRHFGATLNFEIDPKWHYGSSRENTLILRRVMNNSLCYYYFPPLALCETQRLYSNVKLLFAVSLCRPLLKAMVFRLLCIPLPDIRHDHCLNPSSNEAKDRSLNVLLDGSSRVEGSFSFKYAYKYILQFL